MAATPEQKRVNGRGRSVGKRAEANGTLSAIGRLQEILDKEGLDLADLGTVEKIRVSEYQSLTKNNEGEAEIHDLKATALVLSPSWETGPKWPVVQPAKPVAVKIPKRTGPALVGTWKTCLFLPDEQIGFRRLADGTLDPFHDPRALNIALQIAEAERPDRIIHAGDTNDFAPFSRHRLEPGFALTVQAGIDYAYAYLAALSELTDEHDVISGNHDVRLQNYIIDNALAAFGVRRGGTAPTEWPVLSIQNLLRFDEIGVNYVGSYPAGATYLNDNLAAVHGAKIGNRTRTAAQIVVEDERVSILHGHTHKRALASKTRNSKGAPKFSVAYSPGCLCRIDGAVPSTKGSIDAFGAPVRAWEDWQQGLGVIRYQEANGRFAIEDVPIFEGWAMHRGQEFNAKETA